MRRTLSVALIADSAAFGALIGAGSGVGVGLASFGTMLCESDGCNGGWLLPLIADRAAVGAGIGVGVGAARKGGTAVVDRAPLAAVR